MLYLSKIQVIIYKKKTATEEFLLVFGILGSMVVCSGLASCLTYLWERIEDYMDDTGMNFLF